MDMVQSKNETKISMEQHNFTEQLDMSECCRLCCTPENVNNDIFCEKASLYLKMMYLPIKISKSDKLPHKICNNCYWKVLDFHAFCKLSIESQNKLRSVLEPDRPIEEAQAPTSDDWQMEIATPAKSDNYEPEVILKCLPQTEDLKFAVDPLADQPPEKTTKKKPKAKPRKRKKSFIDDSTTEESDFSDDDDDDEYVEPVHRKTTTKTRRRTTKKPKVEKISSITKEIQNATSAYTKNLQALLQAKYGQELLLLPSQYRKLLNSGQNEQSSATASTAPTTGSSNPGEETKPKKRKRQPEKWQRNIRKMRREAGQEYIDSRGKLKPAKVVKPGCEETCKLKCTTNFDSQLREQIKYNFYTLTDEQKCEYYSVFTRRLNKDRQRSKKEKSRREYSFLYFLPKEGSIVRVCKTFFCSTLAISVRRVYYYHLKQDRNSLLNPCKGKGKFVKKETPPEKVNEVMEHISSFPTMESQCCASSKPRRYLPAGLSVLKMHALYAQQYKFPVKENIYRKIFREKFNLCFHRPKKNVCEFCSGKPIPNNHQHRYDVPGCVRGSRPGLQAPRLGPQPPRLGAQVPLQPSHTQMNPNNAMSNDSSCTNQYAPLVQPSGGFTHLPPVGYSNFAAFPTSTIQYPTSHSFI